LRLLISLSRRSGASDGRWRSPTERQQEVLDQISNKITGAMTEAFDFTIFPDRYALQAYRQHATLEGIAALIADTVRPSKNNLPLIKLAVFGTKPSPEGCLRHDANVQQITGPCMSVTNSRSQSVRTAVHSIAYAIGSLGVRGNAQNFGRDGWRSRASSSCSSGFRPAAARSRRGGRGSLQSRPALRRAAAAR
jgi:hypothetical protein